MVHRIASKFLPRFRDLNDGLPHTVARAAINAKLSEIAYVELGVDNLRRARVPDDRLDWNVPFPDYDPLTIDLPRGATRFRKGGDAPDPSNPAVIDRFDSLEVARVQRDATLWPLNPMGRTGIRGRGMLDKWGPTPAADPILTRYNPDTAQLEVLLIRREDTHEWALPGGKVDPGEEPWQTATRELIEEAGVHGLNLDFSNARTVFAGYVDDSRNTDNAWMESTALHLHLDHNQGRDVVIEAGSDAIEAQWVAVDDALYTNLFASQGKYLRLAVLGIPSANA